MLSVFIEDYEQASALRFHYFQNLSVKTVPLVKLIHSFLYFNYWLILCNNILEAFYNSVAAFLLLSLTRAHIIDLIKYQQNFFRKAL